MKAGHRHHHGTRRRHHETRRHGFSLLELLASVAIMTLLMSVVFSFMEQVQKKVQGTAVTSESNQSAGAAVELMTQEIGQVGTNPIFTQNKVLAGVSIALNTQPAASPVARCVTLNSVAQIYPGDWLAVDSGQNFEIVKVTATSAFPSTPPSPACAGGTATPWVQAVLQQDHCQTASAGCNVPEPTSSATPWPPPFISYKLPYPSGILQGAGTSTDSTLEFFGDINGDGVLNYVVYTLHAPAGAVTMSINGTTYTLYTLYRSITPVTFGAGVANNQASPLAQNILYNSSNKQGPTGQPIFAYPVTVTVGVVPNVMTVASTVAVNLSVAVNPQSLESSQSSWYTMATQIRPLSLAAAVAVSNSGGGRMLPPLAAGLPMSNPGNYYP